MAIISFLGMVAASYLKSVPLFVLSEWTLVICIIYFGVRLGWLFYWKELGFISRIDIW